MAVQQAQDRASRSEGGSTSARSPCRCDSSLLCILDDGTHIMQHVVLSRSPLRCSLSLTLFLSWPLQRLFVSCEL